MWPTSPLPPLPTLILPSIAPSFVLFCGVANRYSPGIQQGGLESGVASLPVESGTKPSRRQFLRTRTLIRNLPATYNGTVRTRNIDFRALLWKEVGVGRTQFRRVPFRSTFDLCSRNRVIRVWHSAIRSTAVFLSAQRGKKTCRNLRCGSFEWQFVRCSHVRLIDLATGVSRWRVREFGTVYPPHCGRVTLNLDTLNDF